MMFAQHLVKKAYVTGAAIILLSLQELAFGLAPESRYPTMDESIQDAASRDAWLAKIVSIVLEEEKSANPDHLQRLGVIQAKVNIYLESEDGYITWKNIFHADGNDYFVFEIDREVFCFSFSNTK